MESIYYGEGCAEESVEHFCDDCEGQEGARLRSIFLLKNGIEFTDPTSKAEWQAKIASGDLIVIVKTNGSFDGGTPNYGPGFGNELQRYINSSFKATYREPNLKGNYAYYQAKKKSSGWKFGYRTETLVWVTDEPCTIAPKAPVEDNINGNVVWEVEVTWNSRNDPEPFDMPDSIFDECFITVEV